MFAEQNASSRRAEDFPPCFTEQNASPKRAEDFPPYGFRIGACRFTAEDETFVIVIIKTAEAMHKGQISVKKMKNVRCQYGGWTGYSFYYENMKNCHLRICENVFKMSACQGGWSIFHCEYISGSG